jgi:hypothetical protein
MPMADETVAVARAHGNAFYIAFALNAAGRAFARADPARALTLLHEGLEFARRHRQPYAATMIVQDLVELEASRGDLDQALVLFDTVIESLLRNGNVGNLAASLVNMAVALDRLGQPEIASTVYGAGSHLLSGAAIVVADVSGAVDHLRVVLGESRFEECVARGAAMTVADAAHYAREQIRLVQSERRHSS